MTDTEDADSAIVLLSGGLDSATTLAIAQRDGYACRAISFSYGQRHRVELEAAARIALHFGVVQHVTLPINLSVFGGSALTDDDIDVPEVPTEGIPVTYVPARNTVFLSLALAWAEVLDVRDLFIGVNAVDYSGYPDCRPDFIRSFERTANLGTRAGVEGEPFSVHSPLIDLTKAEIIRLGTELGVPYNQTVSCYQPDLGGAACGVCDSCRLRIQGFQEAGVEDSTHYQTGVV